MADLTDTLVADIEEARDAMDRDLRALEALVTHETNPRVQAERHPLVVAGIVVGLVLAGFLVVKILRS
jgi:hypothetical protein